MRSAISTDLATTFCRALTGCTKAAGGATEEQRRIIAALAEGVFGVDPAGALAPATPEEAAAVIDEASWRHRLVESMVVLEFACHPPRPALADAVERYAEVLGVHESMVLLGREAVESKKDQLQADYARFADPPGPEPSAADLDDAALLARCQAMGELAPGTLGRAFYDFYQRYDLALPGAEPGSASFAAHDFSHVLAGYNPVQVDELALQAMLVAATDGNRHFASMVAVLGFSEAGMLDFEGLTTHTELLLRPGAIDVVAEALRRGQHCGIDFEAVDHFELADQHLEDVRADLRILPRAA